MKIQTAMGNYIPSVQSRRERGKEEEEEERRKMKKEEEEERKKYVYIYQCVYSGKK